MLRKATNVQVHVQCFSTFFQPKRTSSSLNPQLETVIIEVYSVKGLSLKVKSTETIQGQTLELDLW